MKFIDIKRPIPRKKSPAPIKSSHHKNNGALFLFIIIFLAVILYFSYINSHNTDYEKNTNYTNSIDNLATQISDTTSPEPVETKLNILPTSTPEAQKIDKSQVSITVLNGAGKSGLAQEIKNILTSDNFVVENIGNASTDYSKTIIYCSQDNIDLAQEIKNILQFYPSDIQTDSDLSDNNHITVVVGEETL